MVECMETEPERPYWLNGHQFRDWEYLPVQ